MELSNEFEVAVPIEQAWAILTDIERIAPCLPGAQLQEIEGDHYRGIVKIKVGPITAQYKGQATMVLKDDENHRALLDATGRDTKGAGNASAKISAQLTARGDITHVSVVTDLTVTGKVAQFGRGVLGDVSAKLLTQFVANLETTVLADELVDVAAGLEDVASLAEDADVAAAAANEAAAVLEAAVATEASIAVDGSAADGSVAGAPSPDGAGVRRIDAPEAKAVDLLEAAGSPVLKRALPVLVVVLVVLVILGLRRRSR